MRIKVNARKFAEAAQKVSTVSARKSSVVLFENLMGIKTMEKEGIKFLTLVCGSEKELFYTTVEDAEIVEPGEIAVSAGQITDIARNLNPENDILIVLDNQLLLKCGESNFKLGVTDYDQFPNYLGSETGSFELSNQELNDIIDKISLFVNKDDYRNSLTGIHFCNKENNLIVVSTDGHRLSKLKIESNQPIQPITIPALPLKHAQKFASDNITIHLFDRYIKFVFDNNAIYSSIIEEPFVDFDRVIPADWNDYVKIDQGEFKRTIELLKIIGNQITYRGVFDINNKEVIVSTENPEAGEEGQIKLKVIEGKGSPIKIGFNLSYLQDVINTMDKEVCFYYFDSEKAAILKSNNRHFILIMPIRLED
jgi:DNA polymerase-3 subunit beta